MTVVPGAITCPVTDVAVGRMIDEGEGVMEGKARLGERELDDEGDAKRDSEAVGEGVTDDSEGVGVGVVHASPKPTWQPAPQKSVPKPHHP